MIAAQLIKLCARSLKMRGPEVKPSRSHWGIACYQQACCFQRGTMRDRAAFSGPMKSNGIKQQLQNLQANTSMGTCLQLIGEYQLCVNTSMCQDFSVGKLLDTGEWPQWVWQED